MIFEKSIPKGLFPLKLEAGDALGEVAVILQYLADHYPSTLFAPIKSFRRYQILEWLSYIATELHKGIGPLFNPNLPSEMKLF